MTKSSASKTNDEKKGRINNNYPEIFSAALRVVSVPPARAPLSPVGFELRVPAAPSPSASAAVASSSAGAAAASFAAAVGSYTGPYFHQVDSVVVCSSGCCCCFHSGYSDCSDSSS